MSSACPKCQKPLEPAQVDAYQVRLCVPCKGILLSHADLVKVLEQSWRAVTPEAAQRLEFHATNALKTEPILACPDCGQPMEKYGYMGMTAIPIDRCDRCASLWLDADELQNMILALAKSNDQDTSRSKAMRDSFDPMAGNMALSAPAEYIWLFDQRIKDKRDIRELAR